MSDCLPDELDEGVLVQHVALMKIDGTSHARIQAGVEEAGWVAHEAPFANVSFTLSW